MSPLVDQIPILIFRLSMVAVAAVTLGGLMVIGGASWKTALDWTLVLAVLGGVATAGHWFLRARKA